MVELTKSFINHIVQISLLAGEIILEEYEEKQNFTQRGLVSRY